MKAFYSGQFVLPLPEGHRFPMAKYRHLHDRLVAGWADIQMLEAPRATDGELALAHSPSYVQAIDSGTVSPQLMREIGFPWSAAMVERSRRSVGATIAAARAALDGDGLAANMAGGTHHASADQGGGFCVFNDVAVAACLMQAEWSRQYRPRPPLQVAVIDLDVHQGNGTARIFQNDPTVFTLSLHGAKNFPFRKETSDLDVELPDGCADDEYLNALDVALDTLAQRFDPQLLFFLAGADAHEGDRLGRLKLTFDGMVARDRRVFDWAWTRKIPMAFAMAGGYGKALETTVQCQVNTFAVALEYAQRWASWKGWQNRGLSRAPH